MSKNKTKAHEKAIKAGARLHNGEYYYGSSSTGRVWISTSATGALKWLAARRRATKNA